MRIFVSGCDIEEGVGFLRRVRMEGKNARLLLALGMSEWDWKGNRMGMVRGGAVLRMGIRESLEGDGMVRYRTLNELVIYVDIRCCSLW